MAFINVVSECSDGGIAVGPQSRVKAITQDRLGRLWISMRSGTFRLEGSSWIGLESLGGPEGTATAEFTDAEGRIWFGFANTVAMLDGDRIRIFGKDSVQVGAVTSIQGKGTKIWIGGEFGLEFFGGSRFHPVNPWDGSIFGSVSGIVVDPEDGLWFSENRGIIHIGETQLRQLGSKVRFGRFGWPDGLTAQLRGSLASPAAVQTTDGRMWFATTDGRFLDRHPAQIAERIFRLADAAHRAAILQREMIGAILPPHLQHLLSAPVALPTPPRRLKCAPQPFAMNWRAERSVGEKRMGIEPTELQRL
jgi:ligand-binding sensor domain-containing protein